MRGWGAREGANGGNGTGNGGYGQQHQQRTKTNDDDDDDEVDDDEVDGCRLVSRRWCGDDEGESGGSARRAGRKVATVVVGRRGADEA